jgi:hypothetical protein
VGERGGFEGSAAIHGLSIRGQRCDASSAGWTAEFPLSSLPAERQQLAEAVAVEAPALLLGLRLGGRSAALAAGKRVFSHQARVGRRAPTGPGSRCSSPVVSVVARPVTKRQPPTRARRPARLGRLSTGEGKPASQLGRRRAPAMKRKSERFTGRPYPTWVKKVKRLPNR